MISENPLSQLAEPLTAFAQAVLSGASQHVKRLRAERGAALAPVGGDLRLLDRIFDETFGHICGGKVDDVWWRALLDRFAQFWVAPEFLQKIGTQQWLQEEGVRADLEALARAHFLPPHGDEDAAADRLSAAYAGLTGEDSRLAKGPINVVVAVLVAGYEASLDSPRGGAALFQAGVESIHGKIEERFDRLEPRLVSPSVVELISEKAKETLRLILRKRKLDPGGARAEIKMLLGRLAQGGDLSLAGPALLVEVLLWAARLHATQTDTLTEAISYRDRARELDPTTDTRIVDAWVSAVQGEVDSALRTVREVDSSDGRANLFGILSQTRGVEEALSWFIEQPDRDAPAFLTGMGWHNVAASFALQDRWDEALECVTNAQVHADECPALVLLAGRLHATMLLPARVRQDALQTPLYLMSVSTVDGTDEDHLRELALSFMHSAIQRLEDLELTEAVRHARLVMFWLRLTDSRPEIAEGTRREVAEGLRDGARGVYLLPLLMRFDIPFDPGPVREHLERQKRLGGLTSGETVGEFFLALKTLPPKEWAEFIEREEPRFVSLIDPSSLTGSLIESLARDRQFDRARSILEERKSNLSEVDYKHLKALIDAHAGVDVRGVAEELYRSTQDLTHLRNLVNVLGRARDWTALRPRLEELFQLERTQENAERLVECLRLLTPTDDVALVSFLEANPDLLDKSTRLAEAQGWSYFRLGRWQEADALNRRLLQDRGAAADLLLDINVALQTGDWERFSVIVEREWPKREQHSPTTLLHLARLAAESNRPDQAMTFARTAAEKAPNDPHVLIAAASLGFELGCEEEADPVWLSRAAELSSESGPVQQVSLRKLVEEMIPAHRERSEKVERGLVQGEIPLHFAATALNVPLSNLLLELPRRNAAEVDGRRRIIIPVLSGARNPVDVQAGWTIGLDLTSLLLLSHLGLLKATIAAAGRVALAPETMPFLLNERRRALFHQPSRVRKAEEVIGYLVQERLRVADGALEPPAWLVDEVGRPLAQLLESARASGGRVVHPLPVRRLRSFQEVEAELREYGETILTTVAFARILHERGHVDSAAYRRARGYLQARDRDEGLAAVAGPYFLDDLALTYLQDAGLLPSVCSVELDLRVHPSTRAQQEALIEANREGDRLAASLDGIRKTLRDALARNEAIFLAHRSSPFGEGGEEDGPVAPGLRAFLEDVGPCDAVCVDDRLLNRHATWTDRTNRVVPIICTLDLLRFLETQGEITPEERREGLHRLRAGAFGLVPVLADELETRLRAAAFDDQGRLLESSEMRAIRQTTARLRSLDVVQQPLETPFLDRLRLEAVQVLFKLWGDQELSPEHSAVLSDWVWRHVAPSPADWARTARGRLGLRSPVEAFGVHLSLLLQVGISAKGARREAFTAWVESAVLEPLSPANPALLDGVATFLKNELRRLIDEP